MAELDYSVKRFGREQEPVVVIDDFYSDPEALRRDAESKSYQKLGPFYPGIRAQANPAYLGERMEFLTHVLKTVFGFQKGANLTECAFSLVTTPRHRLIPIQCLPHYDGTDSSRLAILHYLSSKDFGGTSFFRHRTTGYETITQDRFEDYKTCLEAEVKEIGIPVKTYFNESSSQFERIGTVDAVVNRCILYRGITLHSGAIPKNLVLSDNPSYGRLTINTFMTSK